MYKLTVCSVSSDGKPTGRSNQLALEIPSIKAAHQIASICNVKYYKIQEEQNSCFGKPVFTSPALQEWETAEKAKSDKHHAIQNRRCEIINSWPKEVLFDVGTGILGLKIAIVWGKAEYNPRRSKNIYMSKSFKFYLDDQDVTPKYFCISDYFTESGAVRVKKFLDDGSWNFPSVQFTEESAREFLLTCKMIEQEAKNKISETYLQAE